MIHIINLEEFERELIDRAIEVYKLPLEFILGPDESTGIDSDYFYNCDTDENLYLEDGLDYILEAINSDDRELFCEKFHETEQTVILKIMAELGLTTETMWKNKSIINDLPEFRRKFKIPCGIGKNNRRYYIVAEKWPSAQGHDEIGVWIEDQNKVVIQDIVRVEQLVEDWGEPIQHANKIIDVKVYADEHDEDFTNEFKIKVYDGEEETTNY